MSASTNTQNVKKAGGKAGGKPTVEILERSAEEIMSGFDGKDDQTVTDTEFQTLIKSGDFVFPRKVTHLIDSKTQIGQPVDTTNFNHTTKNGVELGVSIIDNKLTAHVSLIRFEPVDFLRIKSTLSDLLSKEVHVKRSAENCDSGTKRFIHTTAVTQLNCVPVFITGVVGASLNVTEYFKMPIVGTLIRNGAKFSLENLHLVISEETMILAMGQMMFFFNKMQKDPNIQTILDEFSRLLIGKSTIPILSFYGAILKEKTDITKIGAIISASANIPGSDATCSFDVKIDTSVMMMLIHILLSRDFSQEEIKDIIMKSDLLFDVTAKKNPRGLQPLQPLLPSKLKDLVSFFAASAVVSINFDNLIDTVKSLDFKEDFDKLTGVDLIQYFDAKIADKSTQPRMRGFLEICLSLLSTNIAPEKEAITLDDEEVATSCGGGGEVVATVVEDVVTSCGGNGEVVATVVEDVVVASCCEADEQYTSRNYSTDVNYGGSIRTNSLDDNQGFATVVEGVVASCGGGNNKEVAQKFTWNNFMKWAQTLDEKVLLKFSVYAIFKMWLDSLPNDIRPKVDNMREPANNEQYKYGLDYRGVLYVSCVMDQLGFWLQHQDISFSDEVLGVNKEPKEPEEPEETFARSYTMLPYKKSP
jgi:hypothetical protein